MGLMGQAGWMNEVTDSASREKVIGWGQEDIVCNKGTN